MSTEVIEKPKSKEVAIREAFEVTKQQIAEFVNLARHATVVDHEDREGMKLCRELRLKGVKMRTAIEGTRKELKADVLERGRLIDKIAKELSAPLPEAEQRLKDLEETAKREQERLEAIEKEKREAEIKRRIELADSVQLRIPLAMLGVLSDDEFKTAYEDKKADNEAAEKAAAELAEQQRREQERLEKAAAEQKAREEEVARKEAEIAAKQKAIEDAERARREKCLGWRTTQLSAVGGSMDADAIMAFSDDDFELYVKERRVEFEKQQAEKAESERIRKEQEAKELEARIKAEAKERAEKLEADRLAKIERERAKAERKAARAPDIEKVRLYAAELAGVPIPSFRDAAISHKLIAFRGQYQEQLADIIRDLSE